MRYPTRPGLVAVALALLASLATSLAQEEIGTLTGELGGEARTWSVVAGDATTDAGLASHWSRFMSNEVDRLVVAAVAPDSPAPEGAVRITMRNSAGFPDRCPCTFRGVDVVLWAGPDAAGPRYASDAAEVVVTVAEGRAGGSFRVEGTVTATLHRRAAEGADPDPSESLELRGAFEIPRLPQLD